MGSSFRTSLLLVFFWLVNCQTINGQPCPSDLVLTIQNYFCNSANQTYDVTFTIHSAEPLTDDPWYWTTVTPDAGSLTSPCQFIYEPGNPSCNYTDPPNFQWICACDGQTWEVNGYPNFADCTGLAIVQNGPCDGTYPVQYLLSDIPLGQSVNLFVTVTIAISLPDVVYPPCEYNLTIPAQPGPNAPASVTGPNTTCGGATQAYSTGTVVGATSYQWTVPADATITSGQGTKNITVKWGNTSGQICVAAQNACGVSTPTCKNVTITPAPVVNLANGLTVCGSPNVTLDAGNPGSTYSWSTGATSQTIQANTSGSYRVTVTQNGCSAADTVAVSIQPPIQVTNITNNGLSGSFQVSGGLPQMNGSNYTNVSMALQGNPGVMATVTGGPFTQGSTVSFTAPQAGTYEVVVTDGGGCSGSAAVVVTGGGSVTISGKILTSYGIPIDSVLVSLFSEGNLIDFQVVDSAGGYSFEASVGSQATIIPYKNINHQECITIWDILRIKRFLLNIQLLQYPYSYIAADANKDSEFSLVDIAQISGVLTGFLDTFPYNNSWRFADAEYTFPQGNPLSLPFPEALSFDSITTSVSDADFIGIKIGDVNNCQQRLDSSILQVSIKSDTVMPGATWTMHVNAYNFKQIQAFEFALKWDTAILELDLNSVGPFMYNLDILGPGVDGIYSYKLNNNTITIGYASTFFAFNMPDGDSLITLNFLVKGNPGDSSLIEFMDTPYIPLQVIDTSLQAFNIGVSNGILYVQDSPFTPEMVPVPGGTFTMGCTPEQDTCSFLEKPPYTVGVSDFAIGKYEVTQAQWEALMGNNPSLYTSCGGSCPVETVSWYDIAVFCNRLSEQEGLMPCYYSDAAFSQVYGKAGNTWSLPNSGEVYWKHSADGYRMPLEAEWEYAARGAQLSQGYKYAGGNILDNVAWHTGNSGNNPHAVGTRQPNELNIYDMSGNIYEWCWDPRDNSDFSNALACEPIGTGYINSRSWRGGSFNRSGWYLRIPYRSNVNNRDARTNHCGFRLCKGALFPPACNLALQYPPPGSTGVPVDTNLQWLPPSTCAEYYISIGVTPGGSELVNNVDVGTATSYLPAQPLPSGDTIYVRITTYNGIGNASGCQEYWFVTAGNSGCNPVSDSLELVKLYDSTNGPGWATKTNWKISGKPINTWWGVTVNTEGCVTILSLPHNQLSDSLPNFNLPNLQLLVMNNNQLTGGIPNLNLPNLNQLSLQYNDLNGDIPNFDLPDLQLLALNNNQLSGPIPNFDLPSLQHLALSGNQLSGSIPNFSLPNLQGLVLSSNQLSGNIPNFNLPNLITLYLEANQLSGNIPNFNLPNLQKLWLYINQLSGDVPNFNLPYLEQLYLHHNQLSGSIPNFNLPNLQNLYLSSNQLSGTIPNFNLPNLKILHLHINQLNGKIPNFDLPSLQNLWLYSNRLSGNVPNFNTPNLDYFWLSDNQLTFSGLPYHVSKNYIFFDYAPQDSIFLDTLIIRTVGQGLTIDLGIDDTLITNQYHWYKDGNLWIPPFPNSVNSNKLTFNDLQFSDDGIYHVHVTNPYAPDLTLIGRKITLQIQNCAIPNPVIFPNPTEQACTGDSVTLNPGVWNAYSWSGGQSSPSITVNTPGNYIVTVTDVNGCIVADTVAVVFNQSPTPTATSPTPSPCAGETILLSATGGTTYTWSGPGGFSSSQQNPQRSNATTLMTGSYIVTVTDGNGCTAVAATQIIVHALPTASIMSQPDYCGQFNGSIDLNVGGAAPFTFDWLDLPGANDPEDRTNMAAGSYMVVVTDANGCSTATNGIVQANNTTPNANIGAAPAAALLTCVTTAVQLTATGGDTYQWSNNLGDTATVTVTTPGAYQVTVMDGNGCTASATKTVTQDTIAPIAYILPPEITELTCFITTISLTATGGGNYAWSGNAGTTASITADAPGTYTVTVTDPTNGCSAHDSIQITQNAEVPVVMLAAAPGDTLDCVTKTIQLTATGGDTYAWSNNAGPDSIITVTTPGVYVVTVTNAAGCTNVESIPIAQNTTTPTPVIGMPPPNGLDCSGGTVMLTVNGLYQAYQWTGGQNTPGIMVNTPGTYSVTVTGANGCTGIDSQSVSASGAVAVNRTDKLCMNGSIQIGGQVFDKNNDEGQVIVPGAGPDCDTVVNVALSFYPAAAGQSLDVTLCPGEMYDFNGRILSQAGVYKDTLYNQADCDSVYLTLKLGFKSLPSFAAEADSAVVTAGESVTVPAMDNDDIPPGGGVSIQILTQPASAVASLSGTTSIGIAVPDIHAVGYDAMYYILCYNECPASCDTAPVFIRILPSCLTQAQAKIPSGITPNGDGLNDEFDPLEVFDTANCTQIGSKSSLVILNRWGEVVFKPDGYEKWDGGQNSGKLLPAGTYYYMLRVDAADGEVVVKGAVNLLR